MKDTFWIDKQGNYYAKEEIDDNYLTNIVNFIAKGGGFTDFLTRDKIKEIYDEAQNRGLEIDKTLEQLYTAIDLKTTKGEKESMTLKTNQEYFDNIDLYGTVISELDCGQVFRLLTKHRKLEKGTIEGSATSNELYLLSDTVGMYFASSRKLILCDIEKIMLVRKKERWGEDEEVYYECTYKTSNTKEVNEEMLRYIMWTYFNITNEEFNKTISDIVEQDKNNTYFEIGASANSFRVYVEFDGEYIILELKRKSKLIDHVWTSQQFLKTIETKDYTISSSQSLNDAFKDFENNTIRFALDLNITKLNNGFVYNNNYYGTIEEILDDYEEERKTIQELK